MFAADKLKLNVILQPPDDATGNLTIFKIPP